MKNSKKLLLAITALVLIFALASCNMVQVNEDKDRSQVVAEVNGEKILKGELLDEYNRYTGGSQLDDKEAKEVKAELLENLINRKLVAQKAKAAGHVVNDELLKEAAKLYEDQIKSYADYLKEQDEGKNEETKTDEEYMKQSEAEYEEMLEKNNYTKDQYIELLASDLALQNYLDEAVGEIKVEDSEIEKYYNEQLEFQKEYPSLIPYYSSITIVEKPAERVVKHILIKLSDEDTDKITELRNDKKDEDADKLREQKLAGIKDKAQEVLNKAKSGEDFEKLIKQYGEDPGMVAEENKDGYKMLRDERMVPEFLEASFALKKDEISDLVATDYGYHIIKVYEASEDEIKSLDDVKEDIKELLTNSKKSEKVNDLLEEWLDAADIKKYEKRL